MLVKTGNRAHSSFVGSRAAERPDRAPAYLNGALLLNFDPADVPANPILPGNESAEELREQAAACRRLAVSARTRAGSKALDVLGDHFDERACKLDPSSQRR